MHIDQLNPLPGIYHSVPAVDYHAIHAISSTTLKRLYTSSPKHVHAHPVVQSEAMALGTEFHAYLLDPDFHTRFFVMPDKKYAWNKKEGFPEKAAHALIRELNEGKTCLSAADMNCIECAYHELRDHPFGAPLVGDIASKKALTEVTLIWKEEIYDGSMVPCKARLDILNDSKIIDPKTTRNANPLKFQWDVLPTRDGLNYWIQAGWYWRGAKANGLDIDGFDFIAIEMEPPHGITWHCIDEAELASMQPKIITLASRWAQCTATQTFPNYPPIRHMISIGEDE